MSGFQKIREEIFQHWNIWRNRHKMKNWRAKVTKLSNKKVSKDPENYLVLIQINADISPLTV